MKPVPPTLNYEPAVKAPARMIWRFVGRVVVTLLALGLVGALLAGLLNALFAPFLRYP